MEKVPGHLKLREMIRLADGTEVAIADGAGGRYLVIASGDEGECWVYAKAGDAAIDCVRIGKASPWDVLHHSANGTVAIYTRRADGSVEESVVLCSEFALGRSVLAAAAA